MNPSPSVLIVGAGPTGLTLALLLAKNGVSVRIIEKSATSPAGRKGFGIQPRTQELHKILGTIDDVLKVARRPPEIKMYQLPGGTDVLKTIQLSPEEKPTPTTPYINLLCMGQSSQARMLQAHLARHGVSVEFGTELISFETHSDRVVAHLSLTKPGGEKGEERVEYKWLVGTDGGRSVVRKQLGISFLGETLNNGFIITGDIAIKGLDHEFGHIWGDNGTKMVSLVPSEGNDEIFSFYFSGRDLESEKEKIASSREELIKCFYSITGRKDVQFGDLVWLSLWKPNIRMVESFSKGRVFLAGDASHCHAPTGGQGLNSGIQDSFNLAWKLSLVEKGLASRTLLDSYSAERLPVIAAMLDKTSLLYNRAFAPNPANDGRNFARGREINQLGVNYRASPIVVDDFRPKDSEGIPVDPYGKGLEGGPIRAGDRAPDSPGLIGPLGTKSLFDIFGATWHTVLVFGSALRVEGLIGKYPAKLFSTVVILPKGESLNTKEVLVDSEGYAFKTYNAEVGGRIVVVRPDGFVGAIARDVDGLGKYLNSIFL